MIKSYQERLSDALKEQYNKFINPLNGEFVKENIEILDKCPVCENRDFKTYCIKDHFIHKECANCGLVYLDPKLSRKATLEFYNSPVNEIYNESKFHNPDAGRIDDQLNLSNYDLILKNLPDGNPKNKKLLEIGPGKGTFLAHAVKDGFEGHAVELNLQLIENLRKTTPHVYTDDLQHINLPDNFFDVIYFRDVMEHIDMPVPFLREVTRVLKPGGIVMIDTHNIKSLVNSATKEYHTVLFAFEHPLHWSSASLKFAGEKAGLSFQKVYFNHDYQSLQDIAKYYFRPTFTYIYPPTQSKFKSTLANVVLGFMQLRLVQKIDREIMALISRVFGKGAKMQVVFTKK